MDLWHRILTFIDHERGLIAGVVLLVSLVSFVGCGNFDGRVVSTTTGETVDAAALEREYILESNAIEQAIGEQRLIIDAANARIASQLQRAETLNTNIEYDETRINEELAAQDRLIESTVGAVSMAIPGSGQYLELILGAFGIGGVGIAGGTFFDNRRKNKIIKHAKGKNAVPVDTVGE